MAKKVKMNVPVFFTDLYTVMDWVFSYCSIRHGGISYPEFIMTLYGDMMNGDFGQAESLTRLCCIWLRIMEKGGNPSESFEYLDDTCVAFDSNLSESVIRNASVYVDSMEIKDRTDWIHNVAELIKNGELDD